jgi:hypothetical protein
MFWFGPAKGRPNKVAGEYQVRTRKGWVALVRWDSDHGHFHRHEPGWPEPGAQDYSYGKVPMAERRDLVLNEIAECWQTWQSLVPEAERDNG